MDMMLLFDCGVEIGEVDRRMYVVWGDESD